MHQQGVRDAPWAIIAVMGVTGAGKSTFIKSASGDDSVPIGHSLRSCTSELKGYSFHFGGWNINLIDSPGFNDTFRSESEVLQDIAEWLKDSYQNRQKLSGVVYMHPIKNERMEGSAMRNLKMFRELCGDEPLKNVILVTSFWDQVQQATARMREEELRTTPEFWGRMIGRGSRINRFEGRESALHIIMSLVNRNPLPFLIQHEMVEERKELVQTAAGIAVNEELARLEAKHTKDLEDIKREHQEALATRDKELQEELLFQRHKLEEDIEKVQRQQRMLREQRRQDQRRMQQDLDQRFWKLESQLELPRQGAQVLGTKKATVSKPNPISRFISQGFSELDFDWVVSVLRANESKLLPDDRLMVELKIQELQNQKHKHKVAKDKDGRNRLQKRSFGSTLLQSLRLIFPTATMALLGFPVTVPGNIPGPPTQNADGDPLVELM
ncbi:hypothetical protein P154DRAFT_199661 [Amniculicola lignicola CBS 123094]|uniref:G domain-containing protein n=1 Tax=Amniculicola lignicola CBS 123094 TaxID=1392246 RepID=A0A6A5WNI1_9PLEO|nr:hypothetical protein P154DRAFT_199661 [Amniculicola lignicola CBS 123094]